MTRVCRGEMRYLKMFCSQCEVLFLDHGDTDTVSRDALRPLSREMNQLPYQVCSTLVVFSSTSSFLDVAALMNLLFVS